MYHIFLEELDKLLSINRTLNDIICNDSVQCDGWNDQVTCPSDKWPLDTTANALPRASISP